jgi:cyclopropane fatty-acyl-phospholipid synthase-like methyltransferase
MNPDGIDLDWRRWFQRWEAMQNCYVPQRLRRFELMLTLPNLPREAEIEVLDLGCGPGSLAFFTLERYPNAHVVGVDLDAALLAIGEQMAKAKGDHIRFVRADLRDAAWWSDYHAAFDLILSATTLHWLNGEHLAEVFEHAFTALKPGGWFLNSDHAAGDDPETQARYNQVLEEHRFAAFASTHAERWDEYWEQLKREFRRVELPSSADTAPYWEGDEDGQPVTFQLAQLREYGFEQVDVYWQDHGEAVIGGRKPPAK